MALLTVCDRCGKNEDGNKTSDFLLDITVLHSGSVYTQKLMLCEECQKLFFERMRDEGDLVHNFSEEILKKLSNDAKKQLNSLEDICYLDEYGMSLFK